MLMHETSNKLVIRINKSDGLRIEDLVFVFFFSGPAFNYFIIRFAIMIGIGIISHYLLMCFYGLIIVGILIGLLRMNDIKLRGRAIFLFILICILFLLSYLLNPGLSSWYMNEEYGLSAVFGLDGGVFSAGVIALFAVLIQKDSEHIFRNLKICSIFLIAYLFILGYGRITLGYFNAYGTNGLIIHKAYNMSFGYLSIFISCLYILFWTLKHNVLYIIISIFFALASISFGSRGAIIILALFGTSVMWDSLKEAKAIRKITIIIAIGSVALLLFLFFTEIMLLIQQVLVSFGVSNSRTLTGLISGEIGDANNRDILWPIVIELIKERFPFGYGVFGERIKVGESFRWGYSHNIFLELTVAFGLIGLVLAIHLLIKSFQLINDDTDKNLNMLFILFFSQCGMLLVSNSFWYHPYFWAAIAIGMTYSQKIKKTKKQKTEDTNSSKTYLGGQT